MIIFNQQLDQRHVTVVKNSEIFLNIVGGGGQYNYKLKEAISLCFPASDTIHQEGVQLLYMFRKETRGPRPTLRTQTQRESIGRWVGRYRQIFASWFCVMGRGLKYWRKYEQVEYIELNITLWKAVRVEFDHILCRNHIIFKIVVYR